MKNVQFHVTKNERLILILRYFKLSFAKKKFLNISRLENTPEFKRFFLDMRDLYLANELHKACRPVMGNSSKAESLIHLNLFFISSLLTSIL
jgi:hypothetical protein